MALSGAPVSQKDSNGTDTAGLNLGRFSFCRGLLVRGMRAGGRSVVIGRHGMIHHRMLARPAAAMPAPPPMQRKPIRRSVIAVRTVGTVWPVRTAAALAVLRWLVLRLAAGNERREPLHVTFVVRHSLRTRLCVLRLMLLRLVILRLIVGLLARIVRLRLARCEWLAAEVRLLVVAVVKTVVSATHLAGLLLLVIRLALPQLFLRGRDDAEIVLGVLVIVFRGDWISGALRVAGELEIFFGDVGCRSSNFYVRSTGLVHSRQRILMMATLSVTPAHTLVLTVSHGSLFANPRYFVTALMPPLVSPNFAQAPPLGFEPLSVRALNITTPR